MAVHRFKNCLYHYTTCESLFGMLQGYSEENPNFTMWATHYAFMNDSSEYEFGKRVCKEAMQIYENRNGITGELSFFTYLPDDATGNYYTFGNNKQEQAAKAYWDLIKNKN